ncbi:MAG TPA: NAD(P)H-binding protein, partial [Thermoanaerobaculia bacterium]|nr:NAD(P)H-binding protein [Thermoanaerobaculia bacterium]
SRIMSEIFITGGTGYLGQRLIPELLARGHRVRALVRRGSERKLPLGAEPVLGDALNGATFADRIAPADTFVQLVGVPHPSPAKAAEFRAVDLVSAQQSIAAACDAGVRHFVYLSVAQPAPIMQDYVAVRAEGERLLRESRMHTTFVRPWYILGPGHRWPYAILPFYWLAMALPNSRDTARRLYPVKLAAVVRAIAGAIDDPPAGVRVIEAEEMRGKS